MDNNLVIIPAPGGRSRSYPRLLARAFERTGVLAIGTATGRRVLQDTSTGSPCGGGSGAQESKFQLTVEIVVVFRIEDVVKTTGMGTFPTVTQEGFAG